MQEEKQESYKAMQDWLIKYREQYLREENAKRILLNKKSRKEYLDILDKENI